jgi:hypothetical protein
MKPVAAFRWSLPSRSTLWAKAWNPETATYDPEYVSPKSWTIILNATASKGGGVEISTYRWEIKGLDGIKFSQVEEQGLPKVIVTQVGQPATPTQLAAVFPKFVPKLGRYSVTLTVTNKNGEKSDPVTQIIRVQDLLVVSLGDSMASGEGNPDVPVQIDLDGNAIIPLPTAPNWTDKRCHRSQRSGHARAAKTLEWEHRSVTFLSFACSGARVVGGVVGSYDGIDSPSGPHDPLPSQIDAAAKAIGKDRDIDVLLITGGLNDLGLGSDGFSSVILAFINPLENLNIDDVFSEVEEKVNRMPDVYNKMGWELSRRLHNRVKRVYLTQYPYDIFQPIPDLNNKRQGCFVFINVTDSKGDFLFEQGKKLSRIQNESVSKHGWNFVSGIVDAFDTHGYCTGKPFYVQFTQSIFDEGTYEGTIHPNNLGQREIAHAIVEKVQKPVRLIARKPKKVTVVFEKIKINAPLGTDAFVPSVFLRANGQENKAGPVNLNKEIVLSATNFTFSFIVDDNLAGRIVELSGDTLISPPNPETPGSLAKRIKFTLEFDAKSNFGAGRRIRKDTDATNQFSQEVTYSINVVDAPTPNPLSLAPTSEKQVTIVLEKMTLKAPLGTDALTTASEVIFDINGIQKKLEPQRLNKEITLPEAEFTIPYIVDLGQQEPFFELSGSTILPQISPEIKDSERRVVRFAARFTEANNFGDGSHVSHAIKPSNAADDFEVHYSISVKKTTPVVVQAP